MPIVSFPDDRPEPATVLGLTLLVSVQCQCGEGVPLGLVNAQPAVCEGCGAVFTLDRVAWAKGASKPEIVLSASPSRAQVVSS